MKPFVSPEEMRELDRRTIEEAGISGAVLMARAGEGIARFLMHRADRQGLSRPSSFEVLAGPGNNGGDGFVVARLLHEAGHRVRVLLATGAERIHGDAKIYYDRLCKSSVAIHRLPEASDWEQLEPSDYPGCDVVVDALLGTGSSGDPRGVIAGAIQYIQARSQQAQVVAVDLPSGLDAKSGLPGSPCVVADATLTLGAPKTGFIQPSAWEYTGAIETLGIGIPSTYFPNFEPGQARMVEADSVAATLPRRARSGHKGSYGHVLLVGGSMGYTGAIGLAARAALRSGVGLVTVLTPASVADAIAAGCPEAMVIRGLENREGTLSPEAWQRQIEDAGKFSAILAGPGMRDHSDTLQIVRRLLLDITQPMVLDADALNVFAGRPHWLDRANGSLVLTPHPGELARLAGIDIETIQADRIAAARNMADMTNSTIVLKGAGTCIGHPNGEVQLNLNGNPGLACGGTGDVLAGLLVGLLAQGIDPKEACAAAVYLHGRSGDEAATRLSQAGLSAMDLIDELPYTTRSVCGR